MFRGRKISGALLEKTDNCPKQMVLSSAREVIFEHVILFVNSS